MIQRIQTLILLSIVGIGVLLLFLPVLQFVTPEHAMTQHMYEMSATSIIEVTPNQIAEPDEPITMNGSWGLTLTTALIPFLALVDIFLYKKRLFQARFNIFLAMLCLGYYAVLGVFVWFGTMQLAPEWHICFGACLPLVCFILTLVAIRYIIRDEALVRSADRIR